MAKHGPAKENKFNTVLCKLVNQLSGQRNQPQSDKDGQKISSVHDTAFVCENCLITITQRAHIYNFHTSNLCLKKYFS